MENLEKYIYSNKIVIFYFYSKECHKTNKLYNKLSKNLINNNIFMKNFNVDDLCVNNILSHLNINCYPTFVIYKNGKFIDQIIGILDNIEVILKLYINS